MGIRRSCLCVQSPSVGLIYTFVQVRRGSFDLRLMTCHGFVKEHDSPLGISHRRRGQITHTLSDRPASICHRSPVCESTVMANNWNHLPYLMFSQIAIMLLGDIVQGRQTSPDEAVPDPDRDRLDEETSDPAPSQVPLSCK
ncbi:hypothetical protein LIA77_04820 [Sarocladium implicatum]|nr:hypothetical protein LIA77_04820 [Sarocladium implicatum]